MRNHSPDKTESQLSVTVYDIVATYIDQFDLEIENCDKDCYNGTVQIIFIFHPNEVLGTEADDQQRLQSSSLLHKTEKRTSLV